MQTGEHSQTTLTKPPSGLELLRLNKAIATRKRNNRATEMERFIRSKEWDWFVTITSKHHLTLPSARRVAKVFHNLIKLSSHEGFIQGSSNHKLDINKGNDGLSMWVAEPHKHATSGYHLHFLIKLPRRFHDLTNKQVFRLLLDKARLSVGGTTWLNSKGIEGLWHRIKLEPYKGAKASEYCAKYLTKDFTDYDFTIMK